MNKEKSFLFGKAVFLFIRNGFFLKKKDFLCEDTEKIKKTFARMESE